MRLLSEMGLTPSQQMEIEHADQALVDAWLVAVGNAGSSLKSPTGFFLAGVRSGVSPTALTDDRVRLARVRVRNLRHEMPTEDEAMADIFGQGGLLYGRDDPMLRSELTQIWRERG
jgi:hypothetical protein